jgi:membrane protease YdiL (CAAX protease family)
MNVFAVEVGQIFEVIWVGLLAGVGITTAYSFAVLGSGSYAESRRAGRRGFGWALLTAVALIIFFAGMVFAVKTMLSK